MPSVLIQALQFILCLSLLILLHEAGHFLFARLFKIRVEKFCLFFDWKFQLFKFKPRNSDTTYAIGWIPLGGYVKIAGMIDESMDTEQMKHPVQPWEFRAKPAWQRFLVMIGGVLINFIVALIIYAMLLFTHGETKIKQRDITDGFKFNERAQQLGFRDGDIPLRTNETAFEYYDPKLVNMYRSISEANSVTVLRNGKEVELTLTTPPSLLEMTSEKPLFAEPLLSSVIDSILSGSPADQAGIRTGDRIVLYEDTPISNLNEFFDCVARRLDILAHGNPTDSLKLRQLTLGIQRANSLQVDTITLNLNTDYKSGFSWKPLNERYPSTHQSYTFLESIPAGCKYGCKVLANYVSDLKYLFTSEGAKSVGSFITMGSLFPTVWDWTAFWNLMAFISLMLAFINILPIPALDGGHALFLLYEIITRRTLSDKFHEYAQTAGMILLLLLMALALFNDAMRFIF